MPLIVPLVTIRRHIIEFSVNAGKLSIYFTITLMNEDNDMILGDIYDWFATAIGSAPVQASASEFSNVTTVLQGLGDSMPSFETVAATATEYAPAFGGAAVGLATAAGAVVAYRRNQGKSMDQLVLDLGTAGIAADKIDTIKDNKDAMVFILNTAEKVGEEPMTNSFKLIANMSVDNFKKFAMQGKEARKSYLDVKVDTDRMSEINVFTTVSVVAQPTVKSAPTAG